MRYVIEISYDGRNYNGSQLQGEQPTIQLVLNNTISTLLRERVETFGASRTDAEVHALSNFYHFDWNGELQPDFLYKCNSILPHSVVIKQIFIALHSGFNARFSAISRQYRYRIYSRKNPFLYRLAMFHPFSIEEDILHETASIIKDCVHFETFSKRNTQSKTFICALTQSYWKRVGNEINYVVEANRFLRGMVRGLVGTQLHVARGLISIEEFKKIINGNDCTKAFFNVPGFGLYLEEIVYPAGSLQKIL